MLSKLWFVLWTDKWSSDETKITKSNCCQQKTCYSNKKHHDSTLKGQKHITASVSRITAPFITFLDAVNKSTNTHLLVIHLLTDWLIDWLIVVLLISRVLDDWSIEWFIVRMINQRLIDKVWIDYNFVLSKFYNE